ncbi:MAG: gamma carbonic anhydrase family protein [Deltaproteobacteria bacterium]|nr:gamma carbonic anhydrase family protein [Deltaproteobacteria bacterium]
MPIFTFNGHQPRVDPSAYLAPTAVLSGQVALGHKASVWFGAVVRGDINPIFIGPMSNVQDNCVIHVTHDGRGTTLGTGVCLGHGVILHECVIEDWSLIGMGAVVLDQAVIGPESIVGAGAVVTPKTVIPPGVLALGAPAKAVRPLTDQEKASIRATADRYVRVAETYRSGVPFRPDQPGQGP